MKRFFTMLFFSGISLIAVAQNVGIGTTNPIARLHVVDNSSNPMVIDGTSSMYMSILENGIYRGYWGSFSGNAADVDFGTGVGNGSGKVHLTIQGVPKLTVENSGMVGIGTTSPTEMLDIQSGNIILNNASKGIILDAADRPFITRGFDAFTSGANTGLGRWGIFMEPSRLTLGIPNIAGKGIEFATYNTSGTRNTLLTIDNEGEVKRPVSGAGDLLPIGYANIGWAGGVLSGTGNITVDVIAPGNVYDIGVAGKNLTQGSTVFFLTVTNDGQGAVNYWGFFLNNKIRVVLSRANTAYNRDFSIMIYQP